MSDSDTIRLDVDDIRSWRSIVTLIVFVLTSKKSITFTHHYSLITIH